jgi:hypothetical protein
MFRLPHPALKLLNLHGHAFVNGGNVVQLSGAYARATQHEVRSQRNVLHWCWSPSRMPGRGTSLQLAFFPFFRVEAKRLGDPTDRGGPASVVRCGGSMPSRGLSSTRQL